MKRKKSNFHSQSSHVFPLVIMFRFCSTFDAPFAISLGVCVCGCVSWMSWKAMRKSTKWNCIWGMCARVIVLNVAFISSVYISTSTRRLSFRSHVKLNKQWKQVKSMQLQSFILTQSIIDLLAFEPFVCHATHSVQYKYKYKYKPTDSVASQQAMNDEE